MLYYNLAYTISICKTNHLTYTRIDHFCAGKTTCQAGLVKRFLHARIREVAPVLDEVDAHHSLQSHWRMSIVGPGIETARSTQRDEAMEAPCPSLR